VSNRLLGRISWKGRTFAAYAKNLIWLDTESPLEQLSHAEYLAVAMLITVAARFFEA